MATTLALRDPLSSIGGRPSPVPWCRRGPSACSMTEQWVVLLEAISADNAPLDDRTLDRLLEHVRDCSPCALHATGRYALQLLVQAESGLEAHSIAVDRWRRALAAIGAPVWRAVRVEILTIEEFEREWAAAGFDDGRSSMAAPASCGPDSDRLLRSVFEDPLTQLPTGELFRAKVETTLRAAQRPGTAFALLILQLPTRSIPGSPPDDGGGLDDAVVLEAATRLAGIVRRGDIMARVDGKTLAVLAKSIGTAGAAALARRASSVVTNAYGSGSDRHVAGRAGIALSETGWNADRLFAAASHALGSAKAAPEGWALFRADVPGSAQPPSDAFAPESCADEC